jgi:cytochrome c biogenesis protein CcmG/thiol:disulfide interchange protein DsbE
MQKKLNSTPFLVFLAIIIALYFSLKFSPNKIEDGFNTLELELVSGEQLNLAKFDGQVYIIHLFASWCGICKEDFPYLRDLSNHTGVPIIGVAMNDDLARLRLLNKEKWPYHYIAIDSHKMVAQLVHRSAIPQTIIIDKQGKVAFHHIGGLSSAVVRNQMLPLIH